LLRKCVKFEWGAEQQNAFLSLKNMLQSSPVLGIIQDEGDLVLDVDRSLFATGSVLQQYQENGSVLRILAYASRCFNVAERSYCATRREMQGLTFGLQHFRHYLLGRHFTVRTDHAALVCLKQTAEPFGQLARHLDLIADYDFELQYRKVIHHNNADFLSRLRPCEQATREKCKQCHMPNSYGRASRVHTRAEAQRHAQAMAAA
jgi:hypothetical protein